MNKDKKDSVFTCVLCIDTSGSVNPLEWKAVLSALKRLEGMSSNGVFHVIEADTVVGREYTVESVDEVDANFFGRGGTDYNAALIRAEQLGADICFYYTDGYAPAPHVGNRVTCPMVWLISPGGQVPDEGWGLAVRMETQEVQT